MSQNMRKSSYLSAHPHITKRLPPQSQYQSKLSVSQATFKRVANQLYAQQQLYCKQLQQKVVNLSNQNQVFQQSLNYYSPEIILQKLQKQFSSIKDEDIIITDQIAKCQVIQSSTTPEEYFLFKKNKRLQTFNQSIDLLFQQVNREKQALKTFFDQIKVQSNQIKKEIAQMQRQLKKKQNKEANNIQKNVCSQIISESNRNSKQSRVQLAICQNDSQRLKLNLLLSDIESDSGSSVDYEQLQQLKEQYKHQLQTYEIISQNKQIMTTQLFNNIQSIQESLNKYFELQKTKLFRDITQIKQDFSYMPAEHIIPPNQSELAYEITPLINDYQNKVSQIKKKLSTDLKNITEQILAPLRWQVINFDEYLDLSAQGMVQDRRSAIIRDQQRQNKQLKETQKEYEKLQKLINQQNQHIKNLQINLQEIMSETMIYKQKQHELELAMNNMRKLLRQQMG